MEKSLRARASENSGALVSVPYRDHAAMGDITNHILKLNGRVLNVKLCGQNLLHAAQNGFTL